MERNLTTINGNSVIAPLRPIGTRLKAFRRAAKLNLRDISIQTGYSRTYVGQIERNQTSPSIGYIQKFADVVGVSFGQIVTGKEPKKYLTRGGDPEPLGNVLASVLDNLVENQRRKPEAEKDKVSN